MPNRKYFFWLVLAELLLLLSAAAFFILQKVPAKDEKSFWGNEIKEIRIGKNIFQAEIADTPDKRKQGLSDRKELCENCAMLFLFSERGRHSFWMKGMNFDLDMVWIDNNEIVYIARDVSRIKELERINSGVEADKVLEINAGLADKLGIKVGDKIEF